ncbi:cytoskeleton-associated protein 2 isoform X2 [Rhinatrema bivittatum]|uniref:cytoskeleton-associated protein 2 isoform X2 n=1 Tax=Rhinatrema bivittatum TaxID=194408 RepID=UPI001126246A|nr:cytoskeleton-associated protein 2 isoform X2 [Rhinatrema bivittatum]
MVKTRQGTEPCTKTWSEQKLEKIVHPSKTFTNLRLQKNSTEKRHNWKKRENKLNLNVMKPLTQDMEDKENVRKRSAWNRCSNTAPAVRTKSVLSTNLTTSSETNGDPMNSALKGKTEPAAFERRTQRVSLSQTFLQKKFLNEKQLITEKQNSNVNLSKKPVLGVYRGKIIQSKVNSFRNTSAGVVKGPLENKPLVTTASKPETKTQAIEVKPKGSVPPKSGYAPRPSSSYSTFSRSTEKQGVRTTSLGIMGQRQPERNGSTKSVPSHSIRSVVPGAKGVEIGSKRLGVSAKTIPTTSHVKLTQDPKTAASTKNQRPKESAEERRVRLAEWRTSKGKVMKRPPVQAPEVMPPKEEAPKDPPVQPFWITLLEEDEQGLFTEKVNKTIAEYIKLIDQGCPLEEIFATLENLVQNVPDAKKLAKYWVCLARLEQQRGPIENVISICEKAIQAGAQPAEELQNTLADLLKNNLQKSDAGACVKDMMTLNDEERAEEVISEAEKESEQVLKPKAESENRRKRECKVELKGACKIEDSIKDLSGDHGSPEKENEESTLIKFSVRTTPYLQSVKKKMQFQENDSTIRDFKFLTPVRRSRRIEQIKNRLPKMIQDPDPCVSSIEQLSELGAEMDAFIYRRNNALKRNGCIW